MSRLLVWTQQQHTAVIHGMTIMSDHICLFAVVLVESHVLTKS